MKIKNTSNKPLSILLVIALIVSFVFNILLYNFDFFISIIKVALIIFLLLTIYFYKENYIETIIFIKDLTIGEIIFGIMILIIIGIISIIGFIMIQYHIIYRYVRKKYIL